MVSKSKHIQAAETALGIEPIAAETKKESELRRRWERFFAPLGLALREEYPPQDMWYRIQAALDRADDQRKIRQTKRGMKRWRLAALAAGAIAAGLAAFIVIKRPEAVSLTAEKTEHYIAVATSNEIEGALIMEYNPDDEMVRLRPVGLTFDDSRDFQVWHSAPESQPAPVGLLLPKSETRLPLVANIGDTIAISLEPKDGSPSDAPSGSVLYSGKLTATPE